MSGWSMEGNRGHPPEGLVVQHGSFWAKPPPLQGPGAPGTSHIPSFDRSKNQSFNYFPKLPPKDCPTSPLVGSHWLVSLISGPFPLRCPRSDPTQLRQGMLMCLPFGLLTLWPPPSYHWVCPARDVVQCCREELGYGTRRTQLWIPTSSLICFCDLGLTQLSSLSLSFLM